MPASLARDGARRRPRAIGRGARRRSLARAGLLAALAVLGGAGLVLWTAGRPAGVSEGVSAAPRRAERAELRGESSLAELVSDAAEGARARVPQLTEETEPLAASADDVQVALTAEPRAEPILLELILIDPKSAAPQQGLRLVVTSSREDWEGEHRLESDAHGRCELQVGPGSFHLRLEDVPGRERLAIEPERIEIADDGSTRRTELVGVHRPAAILEALVVRADGAPVAGARVVLELHERLRPKPIGTTDDEGRARIPIWSLERMRNTVLKASSANGEVSDPVLVEAPFVRGERRLVLRPGAKVTVQLSASRGESVAGRRVRCINHESMTFESATLGVDGSARFEGLVGGRYFVSLDLPNYADPVGKTIDLVAGGEAFVRLELPDLESELLCAGLIVDEEETPLPGIPLTVIRGEDDHAWIQSDKDGRFSLHGPGTGLLEITIGRDVGQHRFEPERLTVPIGTRDILLRRFETARLVDVELEVIDARGGAKLGKHLAFLHRPGRNWTKQVASHQYRRLKHLVASGDVLTVVAPGYRDRELVLLDVIDGSLAPGRLTVALHRGLDQRVRILDDESDEPVGGARFTHPSGASVVSPADGWVRISAPDWFPWRIEREGYLPLTWDPREDYDSLPRGIWISRVETEER